MPHLSLVQVRYATNQIVVLRHLLVELSREVKADERGLRCTRYL
jgi:hypothetical protein